MPILPFLSWQPGGTGGGKPGDFGQRGNEWTDKALRRERRTAKPTIEASTTVTVPEDDEEALVLLLMEVL